MKKSAFDIIRQIANEVEDAVPTQSTMRSDIQMMGFKVRQITGDVSALSQLDNNVVHTLWKIGKIDEIVRASFEDLDEDDQDRLLDYLHAIEIKTEQVLQQSIAIKRQRGRTRKLLKLEIFKNFEEMMAN